MHERYGPGVASAPIRPYRLSDEGDTMRMLSIVTRGLGWLLTTVARTLGGMQGAKPFTDSHAAGLPPRREDYRR
jgi:hypothetical protein